VADAAAVDGVAGCAAAVAACAAAVAACAAAVCHLAERAAGEVEDSTWAAPTSPAVEWVAVECSGPASHSGPAELAARVAPAE
jgi:hypothetical protein